MKMTIKPKRIKIFKIRNRRGYAAVCMNNLTEGKTIFEAYDRMVKALRRNGIKISAIPANLKTLVTTVG